MNGQPWPTLFDSLEQIDESVQEAWDKEVARRVKDLEAGRAVTVPWEELRRKLLAMTDERLNASNITRERLQMLRTR